MNCGMKMIKYLLFAFNLIFFIFGIVMIAVGAWVEIKYRNVVQLTGSAISAAPVLVICIGVFIFIVGFFGCCGAYKENYCMVTTFAALMGFILILEVAATISAYVLRAKVEKYLMKSFKKSIKEYTPQTKKAFDFVQKQFTCCGSVNASDWNSSLTFQQEAAKAAAGVPAGDRASIFVPDSCCVAEVKNCGLYQNRTLYNQGCVASIETKFKKNIVAVGGVGVAIIFVQIIGIVFACLLMRTIKSQYEVV